MVGSPCLAGHQLCDLGLCTESTVPGPCLLPGEFFHSLTQQMIPHQALSTTQGTGVGERTHSAGDLENI